MKVNEILSLLDAGFTKEEIMSLTTSEHTEPTPQPTEPVQPEEPKPEPVAPRPVEQVAAAAPVITDEQITKLAQLINVDKASIDIPPKVSLADQLAANYIELMGGGTKEE